MLSNARTPTVLIHTSVKPNRLWISVCTNIVGPVLGLEIPQFIYTKTLKITHLSTRMLWFWTENIGGTSEGSRRPFMSTLNNRLSTREEVFVIIWRGRTHLWSIKFQRDYRQILPPVTSRPWSQVNELYPPYHQCGLRMRLGLDVKTQKQVSPVDLI